MDYQLRVLSGEPSNGIFPLQAGDNLVGRSPECGVIFESAGVSRQHYLIRVEGSRAILENKGRFGTQVDDIPVEGSAELFPGSKIRFGMYMLVQFEERNAADPAQANHDPDKTAELPAFYKPALPEPAQSAHAAEDSFFLRNDDVQVSNTRGTRTTPAPVAPPAPPESGLYALPAARTPPVVPKSPRRRPEDATDPSMMEFDSEFNPHRKTASPVKPPVAPAPRKDDDELFSSQEALPASSRPSAPIARPPPKPKSPPPPANPLGGDGDVHTRGLSPEAIAFMRQEWERKAKGRRTKILLLLLALAAAGGAAAYYFLLYPR